MAEDVRQLVSEALEEVKQKGRQYYYKMFVPLNPSPTSLFPPGFLQSCMLTRNRYITRGRRVTPVSGSQDSAYGV